MDMDSAQDILRCHLCEEYVPTYYCDICHFDLCKACAGEHLLDESREHKVVPIKQGKYNPHTGTTKCLEHSTKHCELHCDQCDIPICVQCVSSGYHEHHRKIDSESIENKKKVIRRDLQELEKVIFPKYQVIASKIPVQKADLEKNSQNVKAALNKHGEDWHREIEKIINKMQSEYDNIDSKHMAFLNNREDEIIRSISEITKIMHDLKKLLDSDDVENLAIYKSRNAEFRTLPLEVNVSLPKFTPNNFNSEKLRSEFGSLSLHTIAIVEPSQSMHSPEFGSPFSDRELMDVPKTISIINTGYKYLYSVACLNNEEIWTNGDDKIMRLFNLKGELLKSIQTKSGNPPQDIAVTKSGNLVYNDEYGTVNVVKNTKIKTLINLPGWIPLNLCISCFGDILIILVSDDNKQTKVARYSGSEEKQIIQYNEEKEPLYSSGENKYITENRNLDICVADCKARAVVVVDQAGKFRFAFTGPPSSVKDSFIPVGITTDSRCRILIADTKNHRIYIINQDGQFFRQIDNCDLHSPWGICVDYRDNLFVAEYQTGKVKKVKYHF